MNFGSFRRTFSAVRFAMNDIGLWRIRKKPIDEILSLLPAVHGVWPQSVDWGRSVGPKRVSGGVGYDFGFQTLRGHHMKCARATSPLVITNIIH